MTVRSELGFCATFAALVLTVSATTACKGGKGRKGPERDEPAAGFEAKKATCKDRDAATSAHLGLKPHFVQCLEAMLSVMKLPPGAKKPFVKEAAQKRGGDVYTIKDYISVVVAEKDGHVAWTEVYFFNKFKNTGGVKPVLLAQALTLAVVFPSADADPRKGSAIWQEIDAIGRKTNQSQIPLARDGIKLQASFLPESIRYKFTPGT